MEPAAAGTVLMQVVRAGDELVATLAASDATVQSVLKESRHEVVAALQRTENAQVRVEIREVPESQAQTNLNHHQRSGHQSSGFQQPGSRGESTTNNPAYAVVSAKPEPAYVAAATGGVDLAI
jgi:hypothetical protein